MTCIYSGIYYDNSIFLPSETATELSFVANIKITTDVSFVTKFRC